MDKNRKILITVTATALAVATYLEGREDGHKACQSQPQLNVEQTEARR